MNCVPILRQRWEIWDVREHKEMLFWTKEEYKKFSFEMMDKPVSFYAFEMLYWCGIRGGRAVSFDSGRFQL